MSTRTLAACGLVLLALAGCARPTETAVPAPAPTSEMAAETTTPTPATDPLADSFATLQAGLDGTVSIAVTPVGGGTELVLGAPAALPAWSTSKVPLALAALRSDPAAARPDAVAAITRSDNEAAERLWARLGTPTQAKAAVEAVLREAGDRTTVQDKRIRPEFTAFGQTLWPVDRQAHFGAELPCLPGGPAVVALMGAITADQRWGLSALPGAAFKGGWGPDPGGAYLVRQIGLTTTPSGQAAIALTAQPRSGSFDEGIAMLNTLTRWLGTHLAELPAGRCR